MTYRRTLTICTVLLAATGTAVLVGPSPAFALDRTPPTVPQGLRVTSTSHDSVGLAWNASTDGSGPVSYRVYVDGARRGGATSPSYTQTGLTEGRSYSFTVRAEDRYGNVSAHSATQTATTTARSAPAAPTNLRVTGVSYDTVSLAWDAAGSSVAYYLIYRNGLWVNSSYGTTGSVNYLAAGSTHAIEVRAMSTEYRLSAPASVSATTKADAGPPTAPANLRTVSDASGTPLGLTWDTSTDDRGVGVYLLFADGGTAFGGGLQVSFYSLTDEYCTVLHGETYTFTVRAMDLSGNMSDVAQSLTVTVP